MVIGHNLEYGDECWASCDGEPIAVGVFKAGELHPLASLCALKKGPRYRFGEMTAAPDQKYFQTLLRHLGSLHEHKQKLNYQQHH